MLGKIVYEAGVGIPEKAFILHSGLIVTKVVGCVPMEISYTQLHSQYMGSLSL